MILITAILTVIFTFSAWLGYRRIFRLDQLNQRRVINSFLVIMGILTLMTIAHWLDYFTQQIAANITMVFYIIAAGFFSGYGSKLISFRKKAAAIEYMYRSFWTDIAPNLIAVILVAFGLYRTGIITLGPFTGIGITSGVSLVAFGFWGWTIPVVPEFRDKGLLFLDQFVPWGQLVAYQWIAEETLEIDYLTPDETLTSFSTYIPAEDKAIIERILNKKHQEFKEENKQEFSKTDIT
ncbi:MAG: hypothetical protein ACNS64_00455 [Candidatus Halalkalibacterium sp. M3_1C_030]